MNAQADSRFYGWWLLLAVWLVYASVIGFALYGTPNLFPLMLSDLGWSRTEISMGFTGLVLTLGFASPVSAWSIGRFGSRLTMFAGALLAALGCFCMQFATTVVMYVVFFGVFVGVGLTMGAFIPAQTIISYWFVRRRGLALGIVLGGGAVGGFIAPPVLTRIIQSTGNDWRVGWLAMSVIMLAMAIISIVFIRNQPSDVGQYPDGVDPETVKQTAVSTATKSRVYRTAVDWDLRDILKTRQLWLLIIAMSGVLFSWQILVTQGPLHLADRGFSPEQYSLIYGVTIGLGVIGRIGGGFSADYFEPRYIFLGAIAFALIGSFLLWVVSPEHPLTLSYTVFTGISTGVFLIVMPNMICNFWGHAALAPVNGVVFPILTIIQGLAAPAAGAIYDIQGSYFAIFVTMWVLVIVAFLAMYLMSPPVLKTQDVSLEDNG